MFGEKSFCFTLICTFAVIHTKTVTEDDLKNTYLNYLLECAKKYPVSNEDITMLKNKVMPRTKEAKCLFACAYKKAGIMNSDGELSLEHIYETSRMVLTDSQQLTRARYFAGACQYVNHVNVGKYDKDCERAALIFQCSVDKAAQADTDEQLKAEFISYVMKCIKDHPVEMEEVMLLQKMIPPKKKETKCLLACAYRTEGTMTAKGLYDAEHGYKVAERMKNGDEKRLENGKKIVDICSKAVNEAQVTDGEKGCERAGLIFKCIRENALKFGFKV